MIRNGSNFFSPYYFPFFFAILCVNFVQKVQLGVGLSSFVCGRLHCFSHRRCHKGALTKSVTWNYWTLWENICFAFKNISQQQSLQIFAKKNVQLPEHFVACSFFMRVCISIVVCWNERKRVQLLIIIPPETHTFYLSDDPLHSSVQKHCVLANIKIFLPVQYAQTLSRIEMIRYANIN